MSETVLLKTDYYRPDSKLMIFESKLFFEVINIDQKIESHIKKMSLLWCDPAISATFLGLWSRADDFLEIVNSRE